MRIEKIEKLLHGMIDSFCESITDDDVCDIIKYKSFIAGGCIPSMLLDQYVNDFDIYLENKTSVEIVKKYFNTLTVQPEKFKVNLITENAINLSDKIQIITKYYGNPIHVVNKFDWAHIKSYYKYDEKLFIKDDVFKMIHEKELIYTGSDFPLSSLLRMQKFIKKGWHVSTKTIVNIVLDIVQAFHNPNKSYKENILIEDDFVNEDEYKEEFSVDEIVHHLNGVDPLTIQQRLLDYTGKYLTIAEIIELL
jgi:hypothetical protein